jgi:cardiolipin synthase
VEVQETRVQTDRVFTVPNVLSMARLVGVPLFLWLILWPVFGGPKNDGWAIAILGLSGVSDYLDGKLARRWGQVSRLGQLLDPLADRLFVLSTIVGLTARRIMPWWLTAILLAREIFIASLLPILRRHGYGPPEVNFIGKAATFNLMYAFPLLLLTTYDSWVGTVASVIGWAFVWWGTTLYWWAGILYAVQTRRLVKTQDGALSE